MSDSNYQLLAQQVANNTERLNQITEQARSIPELPNQDTLNPASLLHVSLGGVSQKLEVQKIISDIINYKFNRLISVAGPITVVGNNITVPPAVWVMENVNYETTSNTVINVPYAAIGYTRNDIIVGNKLNQIIRIVGPETEGVSPAPNVPIDAVLITTVSVTDSTIGDPDPPITGVTTDDVENLSLVLGNTVTEALNSLNSGIVTDRTFNEFSPSKTITEDGFYNAFPSIIKLSNGNLMMAYRKGTEHTVTGNGYIVSRLSTNNGFSWGSEVIILQDAITNTDYRDPSLTQLANGDLILSYFLHTGTDPYAAYQASTIKSSNLGSTWSTPVNLTGYADWSAVSAPVIQLSNGDLLLPSYGHDGSTFKTRIHKSTDNGSTWTNLSILTSETYTTGPGPYYTEPVIIQLANGKILATIRNESTSYTDIKLSTDLGATWGAASQKFQSNSRCNMNLTFNNRIIFSYRWRPTSTASLSSVLRYSDDDGNTFPDNPNYMVFNTDDVSDEYSSLCDLGNGIFAYVYSLETSFTNANINLKYASGNFSVAPIVGFNADGIVNNSTLWQLGRSFVYGKSFLLDNSQLINDKVLGFGGSLGSGGEYAIKYDVDKLRILRSGNEFVLLNNGNLGLNTSNPINKLDVYGPASNASLLFDSSAIANFRGDSNTQLSINSEIASPFAISFQVKNSTTGSTAYPLKLNPFGGDVIIGNLAGSGIRTVVADAIGNLSATDTPPSRPYKVYVALITQSGTSAPVATVLENTLGGTVVWTRNAIGSYLGTLTGAFTLNKTFFSGTSSNISSGRPITISGSRSSNDAVTVLSIVPTGAEDGLMNQATSIEIRVYP